VTSVSKEPAPRGVDEVKRSLVAAARRLLGEMPAAQISGRRIATAAQVNYGLIHQYFGSKQAVFRAVLEELTEDLGEGATRAGSARAWWQELPTRPLDTDAWRTFANLVSSPELMDSMEWDFPLMRTLVAELVGEDPPIDVTEARVAAAAIGSLLVGWTLMEPIYQRGLGLDADQLDAVRQGVLGLVRVPGQAG
jgi:AcrR family transcriptional regulator